MLTQIIGNITIGDFDFDDATETSQNNCLNIPTWLQLNNMDAPAMGFDGEISPRKPDNQMLADYGDFSDFVD